MPWYWCELSVQIAVIVIWKRLSQVGSKLSAINAEPENYLHDFGEDFEGMMYTDRKTTLVDLTPTCAVNQGHLLRA